MMIRIAVEVEEGGAGGLGQLRQKVLVTTFADVHDALDGHRASLSRRM